MPLIEVHLIDKVFNPEQKRQIIEKLTDAMVSIEGENMRGVTWVKISEVTSGDWGIGGQAADHRSRQGTRRGPTRGVTCSFWATSPAELSCWRCLLMARLPLRLLPRRP